MLLDPAAPAAVSAPAWPLGFQLLLLQLLSNCSADNDSDHLGNRLLSAFEAFCSWLQVATSGKPRKAQPIAAVGFAADGY